MKSPLLSKAAEVLEERVENPSDDGIFPFIIEQGDVIKPEDCVDVELP